MPILRPSPSVGGLIMHLLSSTMSVNEMTYAQEGQRLDGAQMDGCSRCPDVMNDTWAHS